jgi:hypothetical protein
VLTPPPGIVRFQGLGQYELGVAHGEGQLVWAAENHSSKSGRTGSPHLDDSRTEGSDLGDCRKVAIHTILERRKKGSIVSFVRDFKKSLGW